MREALLSSVALALVAGTLLSGFPGPAEAAMPGFNFYRNVDPYFDPNFDPDPIVRPSARPVVRPRLHPSVKPNLKPEPAKDFGAMPKGPLQIVVSIADQRVTLYSNGIRVAQGQVSTGVPGRPTPTGVFSIIQKDRFHHSNLYSNAPMPFMERITWSGVALHEGPLPGYPASHGCIRMTHDFAARLWVVARLGLRVIVARNDVVPVDFAHPRLFAPKLKPPEPPVAGEDPDKHVEANSPINFAQATIASPVIASEPATAAPTATDALRGRVEMDGPAAVDPVKTAPVPMLPKTRAAGEAVRHTGTVAVFISRKEKKLFVRQGFEPLFDMPIEIEHPGQALGTHVFTALGLTDNGTRMRWNVMSMAAGPPRPAIAAKVGPKVRPDAKEIDLPQTAVQALDRIQIPQEASDRIGEILSPGASLVISDQGLGEETGEGTDFVVLTR